MPPVEQTTDTSLLFGCYYCHVPEMEDENYFIRHELNTRVTIKTHAYYQTDFRRYWRLASVWFDGNPVMVIQNAGREGDDYSKRFITALPIYGEMINYLFTLIHRPPANGLLNTSCSAVVETDADVPLLDDFYGYNLKRFAALGRRSV